MMMICDAERPVALAGVMGGLETEVSSTTKTVLLESAHFLNTSVRKTRRALGISTEASYRFERSVDPEGVVAAIERFTELLTQTAGAAIPSDEIVDVYPTPHQKTPIQLRISRASHLLGMPITSDEAERYLQHLGFETKSSVQGVYEVLAPSWRPDVVREEDVIEELGRVHGYDRIPEKLPTGSTTMGGAQGYEAWEDKVRDSVLRLGFTQAISHTLRDTSPLDDPHLEKFGPRGINDPEMMWLRSSTLASLADAARRNGGKDVQLFELGQVFGKLRNDIHEHTALGLLCQGNLDPEWWKSKSSKASSFFSFKGILEALAARTLTAIEFRTPSHLDARLHPTRQAEIYSPAGLIGVLGQIHLDAAVRTGLPSDTLLAEINLNTAYKSAKQEVHVRQISKNPSVRRDLAFLIDKNIPYEQILRAVLGASGELLEHHWLFDVYEGKGVPEGHHSLAIALQLRKLGANLTDDEANQVREKVVQALGLLGATPR
jgi:phenylalanyl-tRNA synthetase beta chain